MILDSETSNQWVLENSSFAERVQIYFLGLSIGRFAQGHAFLCGNPDHARFTGDFGQDIEFSLDSLKYFFDALGLDAGSWPGLKRH